MFLDLSPLTAVSAVTPAEAGVNSVISVSPFLKVAFSGEPSANSTAYDVRSIFSPTVAGIAGSLKAIIASSSAVTPIDAIGAAIKRSARNYENSFRRFIMSFPFVYFFFAFISSIA